MSQQISAQEKFNQANVLQTDMAFVLSVKDDIINARSGSGVLSKLTSVVKGISAESKIELNEQLDAAIINILDAHHDKLISDFNTLMQ